MVKLLIVSLIGFNLQVIEIEHSSYYSIEECLDHAAVLDQLYYEQDKAFVWECNWWDYQGE